MELFAKQNIKRLIQKPSREQQNAIVLWFFFTHTIIGTRDNVYIGTVKFKFNSVSLYFKTELLMFYEKLTEKILKHFSC